MSRYFTSAFAIAALLGSFIIVDTAEAAKSRSVVDRRQRPGKGYFAPKTNTNRSYSSSRSMFRSTPRYVAPRTYAPAPTYSVPTYTAPAAPIARSAPVVRPAAPVVQRSYTVPGNVVSSPRVIYSSPVVTSQPRIISERVIAINGVPVNSEAQEKKTDVATQPKSNPVKR